MYYSTVVAYALWALGGFGALGFHRFYMRKVPTGLLWMFTGGLGYVGAIYDFFTLSGQVHEANMRAGYREALNMSPRDRFIILVTPGEIAIESDYSSDDARLALEKLAAKGFCEMRVRPSGVIVYRFPEFIKEDEGFEPGL